MRRRHRYANVTATLALLIALSGTAIAASRYIITSTNQIKPSVLKKLKGAAGAAGLAGTDGRNGTNGTNGSNGANGANGATGPAGSTGPAGPGFTRTVIVSPVGTATQNGTALIAAMNNLTAGISNPAVLLIEPGVYDLGASTLTGKADVDIEGSGQDVTFIEGLATGGNCVVDQAGGTELRSLSIDDGTADPCALDITGGSATVRDVTATAEGSSGSNVDAITAAGSTTLIDTTAQATASGSVTNAFAFLGDGSTVIDGGSFTATNSTSPGTTLAEAIGADPLVANGVTTAVSGASYNEAVETEGTSNVQDSTLPAGILATSGTLDVEGSEVPGSTMGGGSFDCLGDWKPGLSVASAGCT